jgi:hypothetical protein
MAKPPQRIKLEPWLEFGSQLQGYELVSASLGPDRAVYLLGASTTADYRETLQGGGSTPKVMSDQPNDFVVICFDGSHMQRKEFNSTRMNFHFVQPLPEDEILLVCARSGYRSPDGYDLNAHVFSMDGQSKRQFRLGDAIENIQTTSDGTIWTGYFDEGGDNKLAQWSSDGKRLFAIAGSVPEYDAMGDCYAINVPSNEETWCYYDPGYPLVKLRNTQLSGVWPCPIKGAHAFAVWDNYVLIEGGHRHKNRCILLELDSQQGIRQRAVYQFISAKGQALAAVQGRGEHLLMVTSTHCYRVDLKELVQ